MDQLNAFWDIIKQVLETGVMGATVGDILLSVLVLAVFLFGRQFFVYIIMVWLRVLTRRTTWGGDDKFLTVIEGPLSLMPITIGVFSAAQFLSLDTSAYAVIGSLVKSLVTISIFWSAYNLVDILSGQITRISKSFTPVMVEWITRALRILFVSIGVASVLEMWGVNVTAIIAGLGLFGIAIALGAQDLFKNLISGILVIGERRFNRGDWIKVDGVVEGVVESVGFRSTVVRRFDKAPVYVPNSKFSDYAVTNFSAMTHRRISWKIGLEYSSTSTQLKEIRDTIEKYILNSADFAQPEDVSTFVRIDSFNNSSIDMMIYCFTNTTNWGEWLEIKERLVLEIKSVVENAGTGFAFPSQSLYVESLPGFSNDTTVKQGDK